MSRILTFSLEVTDTEISSLLGHFANRGTAATVTDAGEAGDDNAPANPNAPAVDTSGCPWLAEFHAPAKSINKDGSWRRKKGVDAAAATAAEQSARTTPAVNPGDHTVTAVQQAPVPSNPLVPLAAPAPAAMPGLPGMPALAPIVPTVPDTPVAYDDIVAKYQSLSIAGKLDTNAVPAIYAAAGVTDVNDLTTNESLRRALMAELNKLG